MLYNNRKKPAFKIHKSKSMHQTLRKNFSYKSHAALKPILRRGFNTPLSLDAMLLELHYYLEAARADLVQPRQENIDRILREALG
jgi:hypothetical protein